MYIPALTSVAAALLLGAANAQLHWSLLRPPVAPPASDAYALVTDVGGQGLLLFGGEQVASTWRFRNGVWTRLTPASQPSPRTGHSMAYDPIRDRVVLFGGRSRSAGDNNETWEWDGASWTRAHPLVAPSPRSGACAAFDRDSGRVILFGGSFFAFLRDFDETWAWDGTVWTEVVTQYVPGPRSGAAMAGTDGYGLYLFGGHDAFGDLDDLWYFRGVQGGTWSRVASRVRPSARSGHSLTYDSQRQRLVLHGGALDLRDVSDETWELTSSGWVQVATPSPGPAISHHAAAFDAQSRRIVVFGGAVWVTTPTGGHRAVVADTHAYEPTNRWSIAQIGAGCGGVQSVDFLRTPLVGEQDFRLRPVPPFGTTLPTVAVIAAAQMAPPLQLGPCSFHLAQPAFVLPQPSVGGLISMSIPNDPRLSGAPFLVQMAGAERGISGWIGMAFSPAYRIVIGD